MHCETICKLVVRVHIYSTVITRIVFLLFQVTLKLNTAKYISM